MFERLLHRLDPSDPAARWGWRIYLAISISFMAGFAVLNIQTQNWEWLAIDLATISAGVFGLYLLGRIKKGLH
jgi:hypothetical protein